MAQSVGERNDRAARDVLLIGLCTLFLRAPSRLRWEDERKEREGKNGVGLRANITYDSRT